MYSESQDHSDSRLQAGRWTTEEHRRFLTGIVEHGKDWKQVQQVVQTRNGSQVRSHAQKFFLKIQKLQKERRKKKNRYPSQLSETENEILRFIRPESISLKTPQEIVSLIRQESKGIRVYSPIQGSSHHPEESQQSRKQKLHQSRIEEENPNRQELMKKQFQAMHLKDLRTIQESMGDEFEDQDQSFLSCLMKKNRDHFINGKDFAELVDFGKIHVALPEQETGNIHCQATPDNNRRKRSFTLPEEEQDEQRLRVALNSLRKLLKDQRNLQSLQSS